MTGHGNVRFERFREHADYCREFYNTNCKVQIESLIVSISACETSINIDGMGGRTGDFCAHNGDPTNTRFAVAQTTRCIVSRTGILTQSAFHMGLRYLLTENSSRTVTMHGDGNVERPDEFVMDLFESVRNVPCQFQTYYIVLIVRIYIQ